MVRQIKIVDVYVSEQEEEEEATPPDEEEEEQEESSSEQDNTPEQPEAPTVEEIEPNPKIKSKSKKVRYADYY